MNEGHNIPSVGFNPTTVGFPSYLGSNSNYLQMPVISFNSATGLQALGATGANKLPSQSYQIFPTWMKTRGNHTLKAGGDFRQYRLNTFTAGNSTGTFTFNNNTGTRPPAALPPPSPPARTSPPSCSACLPAAATISTRTPPGIRTMAPCSCRTIGESSTTSPSMSGCATTTMARTTRSTAARWTASTPPRPIRWPQPPTAAYAKAPIAQLPASAVQRARRLDLPRQRPDGRLSEQLAPGQPARRPGLDPRRLHGKTVVRAAASACSWRRSPSRPWASTTSTPPTRYQPGGLQPDHSLTATSNNYLTPLPPR
jgi:hypothetical protein